MPISPVTHSQSPLALTDTREQQRGELVQHSLNELLLSPVVKRRAGIELRPQGVDVDADAAVLMVGKYKQRLLKSV